LSGGAEKVSKLHLYVLAAILFAAGVGLAAYKISVLGFPLRPATTSTVWNVEARVTFVGKDKPVKVSMFIPTSTSRYAILDEQFVSGEFGFVVKKEVGNRMATWSIRKAQGKHQLYYQATIRKLGSKTSQTPAKSPKIEAPNLEGAKKQAATALMDELKKKSADNLILTAELIKECNKKEPGDHVKILLGKKPDARKKAQIIVSLLKFSGIPARVQNGIRLRELKSTYSKKLPVLSWIEVYDGKVWKSFSPLSTDSPVADDLMRWWGGPQKLVELEGARNLTYVLSVSPKLEEAIAGAVRRMEISHPFLLKFSLFSLPVHTQAVYKIMLLVPVGALLLVLLRNVVGIKTFGTFMPVLIGLSFRETGLWRGILLFTIIVAMGLAIRFYLERLKLLVVPRLAAVLIVVVGLMAFISVLTRHLGGHTGLSIALFPMVILTMTIERMSIVWEERGASEALIAGIGSMVTAVLAFIVMKINYVEHAIFVFPELLLVLLAVTILLGRYTGYRVLDFYRFKELAKS
jgi:hypothetical protein